MMIGNLHKVVWNIREKSENCMNYFSADFSLLKPVCIIPATQAHATRTQLSLGRQKFCLEVGRRIFYRFVRFTNFIF